jgi:octaprenyl-diphosphate synthase
MIDKIISRPIEEHLKEFDGYFKNLMRSNVSLLDLIIQYITKKPGKRVRPAMVFLSASICGGVNPRSYVGAAMVELLHTATLVHDDVVDEADKRRGIATINATWNNKIAVLIGDYLLGKGLLTAIDGNEFDFLRATSHAVRRMSEGELLQIQKSKEFSSDEETYFRIISDKTASLLAACCEIGAISATDDKSRQEAMREFGEYLGIAFQIRDDIFDYQGNSSIIGKPVGNDLKEKKITLPLLYSLSKVPKDRAKEITRLVKNGGIKKKDINTVIDFVNEQGGIDYAESRARDYINRAVALLEPFEDSPAKRALLDFASYVVERNK